MFIWSKLSSARWQDAWEERFYGFGQTNAVIREIKGGKSVRVEVYCRTRRQAEEIHREFGGSVRRLEERKWTRPPRVQTPPIRIRDALLVTAFDDPAKIARLRREYPGRHVISIPPEMAFGTGDHATTASCLRLLTDIARELNREGEPWDQLDLGTGSGILSLAGRLLGARRVAGIDYDGRAIQIAKRNVARNGLKGIALEERDILAWKPGARERGAYALVTANLFSGVLEAVFPKIAWLAKPGGHVVVSGILQSEAAPCLAAGRKAGICFEKTLRRGKWVSARGRRE